MISLQQADLQNKRVLVRCDFNVPIKDGRILDDFRIQKILPTLSVLKKKGAKIILMSHLEGAENDRKPSLKPVASKLEELLREKIQFVQKCIGGKAQKAANQLKPCEILLLENLRIEKGEVENDQNFAKELAELGDVYVGEHFSVCHRAHSSIVILPKLLAHFSGVELEKEVQALNKVSQNPERPLIVVIGGVKIESKTAALAKFLEVSDHLLLGGKIANVILTVKGICVGRPWPEESIAAQIKTLDLTDPKIHLPVDVLVSPDATGDVYVRETGPGKVRKDEDIFDIGQETAENFGEIIKTAKTIFWSGPLGLAGNEKFSKGTKAIAEAIAKNYSAFKVVGGGDTVAILRKFDLLDKFSYVSTGGGAMLAFLAGEKLPGIEALE